MTQAWICKSSPEKGLLTPEMAGISLCKPGTLGVAIFVSFGEILPEKSRQHRGT